MNRLLDWLLSLFGLGAPKTPAVYGLTPAEKRLLGMDDSKTEVVGGSMAWVPLKRLTVVQLPQLQFKAGVVLCAQHLRPEISKILTAALLEAPTDLEMVTVTEGWRYMRDSRDLHNSFDAFDFSIRDIPATSASEQFEIAAKWTKRIRQHLGRDYDVVFHDAGTGWHIHVEFDPKGPANVLTA